MDSCFDEKSKGYRVVRFKLLFIEFKGCRGEAPAPHLGGRQCRGRPGAPRRAAEAARRFLKNKIGVGKTFRKPYFFSWDKEVLLRKTIFV